MRGGNSRQRVGDLFPPIRQDAEIADLGAEFRGIGQQHRAVGIEYLGGIARAKLVADREHGYTQAAIYQGVGAARRGE